jgi:hypothetical protein
VCRPGRTLVGGVAQPVGAAVGAAHALCLGGVEVTLADHPGGLVAGELQRGGGGQELHQQGGSRSLEEHDRIVLAQVWRAFRCRHAIRQGAATSLWIDGEARRRCFGSGRRHWRLAHACFRRNGTVGPTRSTRPALLPPSTKTARSCSRRRARCGAGTLAEAHPVRPAMRATTHVEGKAIGSSRRARRGAGC